MGENEPLSAACKVHSTFFHVISIQKNVGYFSALAIINKVIPKGIHLA